MISCCLGPSKTVHPPHTHTHTYHDQEASEHDQLLLGPLKHSAPRPRVECVVIETFAARDDQQADSEQAASRGLGTGLVQDRLRRGGGGNHDPVGGGPVGRSRQHRGVLAPDWSRIVCGGASKAGGGRIGAGRAGLVHDPLCSCVSMMDQKHQREGGGVVLREVGIDDQESFILNGGSFLSSQLTGNDHWIPPPLTLSPVCTLNESVCDSVTTYRDCSRGTAALPLPSVP